MPFSTETLARVFIDRYAEKLGWEIATEMGEPSYSQPDGPIVVGTAQCHCGNNPLAGKHKGWPTNIPHEERPLYTASESHWIEDHHPLAYREWDHYGEGGVYPCDEWMVDYRPDTSKAYRTQADSYSWQPSVIYDDMGGYLTPDDDIEVWIDWAHNDDRRCLMSNLHDQSDLEDVGFSVWDPDHEGSWRHNNYETGLHSGQNDSPTDITEAIRDRHGDDVDIVFCITEQSQFYTGWTALIRPSNYNERK